MAREPNWYRMGFETAGGNRKSLMNLPGEFFLYQSEKIFKDDFNVVKYAYDYAKQWLETEQWKQEVGQKIMVYIKKYQGDNKKVDEFMQRACLWSDGYAELIIQQFRDLYTSPVSPETAEKLVNQALQTTGDWKYVTGKSSKDK
ncbi:MAG: hypothetical protein PHW62_00305 [Candidatus Ratteibacteria bacterium]|nr:hypothetical protein [Candidatus Ratteibacteria bacterium]